MKQVIFKKWHCDIKFGQYNNKRIAMQLVDSEGPVAVATINFPDEQLEEDEIIIKDYSENEGMLDSLIEAGIVSEPLRYTSSGYVNCIPICKLLIKPE